MPAHISATMYTHMPAYTCLHTCLHLPAHMSAGSWKDATPGGMHGRLHECMRVPKESQPHAPAVFDRCIRTIIGVPMRVSPCLGSPRCRLAHAIHRPACPSRAGSQMGQCRPHRTSTRRCCDRPRRGSICGAWLRACRCVCPDCIYAPASAARRVGTEVRLRNVTCTSQVP